MSYDDKPMTIADLKATIEPLPDEALVLYRDGGAYWPVHVVGMSEMVDDTSLEEYLPSTDKKDHIQFDDVVYVGDCLILE